MKPFKNKKLIIITLLSSLSILIIITLLNIDDSDSKAESEKKIITEKPILDNPKNEMMVSEQKQTNEVPNLKESKIDQLSTENHSSNKPKVNKKSLNNSKSDKKIKETRLSKSKTSGEKKSKKKNQKFKPKDPREIVLLLHDGLRNSHKENFKNYESVEYLVNETYNVEKMISMIIGKKWNQINKEKQEEVTLVFTEYVIKNYIKRFKKIKQIAFENISSKEVRKNYFLVKTKLKLLNEDDVKIDYLLTKKNGEWKIFDVLLAGSVSEIATKKSEFNSFISNDIDDLIKALQSKNSILIK